MTVFRGRATEVRLPALEGEEIRPLYGAHVDFGVLLEVVQSEVVPDFPAPMRRKLGSVTCLGLLAQPSGEVSPNELLQFEDVLPVRFG